MPSDQHTMLYNRLLVLTARLNAALQEQDPGAMENLAIEQQIVIQEIQQAGLSDDTSLLGLLREVKEQVDGIVPRIVDRRDQLGKELEAIGQRKKQISAYTSIGSRTVA